MLHRNKTMQKGKTLTMLRMKMVSRQKTTLEEGYTPRTNAFLLLELSSVVVKGKFLGEMCV